MAEKPILFSGEMVRAILDGRKTMTRRVIKGTNPKWAFDSLSDGACITGIDKHGNEYEKDVDGLWACFESSEYYMDFPMFKSKYQVGDILWVRETWCCYDTEIGVCYWYKADFNKNEIQPKWRPLIFMPKEAARIFLRVTNVRAERLQEISSADCIKEGISYEPPKPLNLRYATLWDSLNTKPKPVTVKRNGKKEISHYESYPWEDIHEVREHRGKKWYVYGNPFVWVITFERTDRAEL